MSGRLRIGLAMVAAGVMACFPGALDETGLFCSVSRPCGPDFACVNDVCAPARGTNPAGTGPGLPNPVKPSPDGGGGPSTGPDSGTPAPRTNLLSNPGFEEGSPPAAWSTRGGALTAETVLVHQGAQAAKLVAEGAPFVFGPSTVPVSSMQAGTYCFRGMLRGNARVLVAMDEASTGIVPVLPNTWTTVNMDASATPGRPLSLEITSLDTGSEFSLYVDSLELWHSPTNHCAP